MKNIVKILLVIIVILLIFAGVQTFAYHQDPNKLDEYTTVLGKNSNGTVYKIICGNTSSKDTAVVILGVHSLESGIHNATNETLINFTKSNNLHKKYVVYFIKLNFNDSGMNTSDYDTNRHMGELLANKYVVPDVDNYDPHVIVDVHEMEDYWDLQRYVGIIDNKSDVNVDYANKIGNATTYPVYKINSGTSPQWVTIPLYKKGYNVMIFETAQADTQKNKTKTAIDLVRGIDNLPIEC